ncbi:hypothetical protein LTR17_006140 [Elasticomyces elasticus]|nr:hypothetical protein LTR17_006140 [Elasticomyces elasticus]
MDNTNSIRDFSSTRMTPPQQTAHERTTKMDTPTEKHQGSTVAFDTSSNLLHVRASGHKTHPKHLYTEHDAYVQDLHQEQDVGGKKSTGADESAYLERSQSGESVYEDAEEPDLFTKSFPHAKEEDKHVPDCLHHSPAEHARGCNNNNSRSASTPGPSSLTSSGGNNRNPPNMPLTQKKPEEADLVEDVRRSLTQQQKLHDKAKLFTPRLPLDAHRYWICVLHEGRKFSTITSEKHFTWMKGNRLTTIATIWHTHATATLSNNFVLLLGHELVDFKDVCEELDYFNDKFVCLRAVGKDLKQAKGKELGEGCPPEVIEIDMD